MIEYDSSTEARDVLQELHHSQNRLVLIVVHVLVFHLQSVPQSRCQNLHLSRPNVFVHSHRQIPNCRPNQDVGRRRYLHLAEPSAIENLCVLEHHSSCSQCRL